jgi:subtilisin family serine protease
MRFLLISFLLFFLALPSAHAAAPDTVTLLPVAGKQADKSHDFKGRPRFKSEEVLVRFRKGVTEEQKTTLHRAVGVKVLRKRGRVRLHKVKVPRGMTVEAAEARYQASGLVEVAGRNFLRYPEEVPNDPFFVEQWGLHNSGQPINGSSGGTPDADIDGPEAWDITTGSNQVVIAFIDSGVDYLHPDLAANIWVNPGEIAGNGIDDDNNGYKDDIHGYDFTEEVIEEGDPTDPFDTDIDGHGSHVAGIAAAVGNNGIGIAGVSHHAKIMVLKVQPDYSASFDGDAIIEALQYALDNGADIVNCSFGGYSPEDLERQVLDELRLAGIPVVCAAGNDGLNTDLPFHHHYPSGYDQDNIIAVAASDSNDDLYAGTDWNSNYGATTVDVMAPGVAILSTIPSATATTASVTVDGTVYPALGMAYAGTTDVAGITAALYDCGTALSNEACPAGVRDNLALIQRGGGENAYFSIKASFAQQAGARGAIIYNDRPDGPDDTFDQYGGTLEAGDWIPVVSISQANGEALLARGLPLNSVSLKNVPSDTLLNYDFYRGTSMAAPHVSGIAALLLSINPGMGYSGVKLAIMEGVDKVWGAQGKVASDGRVNARSALLLADRRGDVNGDKQITLDDVILALQIVGGRQPVNCPACLAEGVDVNNDHRIGQIEAMYVMQKISGLR